MTARCSECGTPAGTASATPRPWSHWSRIGPAILAAVAVAVVAASLAFADTSWPTYSQASVPRFLARRVTAGDLDDLAARGEGVDAGADAPGIDLARLILDSRVSPWDPVPPSAELVVAIVQPAGIYFSSHGVGRPAAWITTTLGARYDDVYGRPAPTGWLPENRQGKWTWSGGHVTWVEDRGVDQPHRSTNVNLQAIALSAVVMVFAGYAAYGAVLLGARWRKRKTQPLPSRRLAWALGGSAAGLAGLAMALTALAVPHDRLGGVPGSVRGMAGINPRDARPGLTCADVVEIHDCDRQGELAASIMDAVRANGSPFEREWVLASTFTGPVAMTSVETRGWPMMFVQHARYESAATDTWSEWRADHSYVVRTGGDPTRGVTSTLIDLPAIGTMLLEIAVLWWLAWLGCRTALRIVERVRRRHGRCAACGYPLAPAG